jgi:phosphoglycerol transferase MdoB-like AlkP superfamily enzyme
VIYAMSKEKGQQRAASSTFRVLAQAQYQTRAVAAKRVI